MVAALRGGEHDVFDQGAAGGLRYPLSPAGTAIASTRAGRSGAADCPVLLAVAMAAGGARFPVATGTSTHQQMEEQAVHHRRCGCIHRGLGHPEPVRSLGRRRSECRRQRGAAGDPDLRAGPGRLRADGPSLLQRVEWARGGVPARQY
jgi:hypothetical protein